MRWIFAMRAASPLGTAGERAVIEPSVQRAEIERARRKHKESLNAHDLYLQALPHFASDMPEDAKTGMEVLEQALQVNPNYASAHAVDATVPKGLWAPKRSVLGG
jgi:hypothetical protein